MKITFIDAGVLISAARGDLKDSQSALALLDDPERIFASSPFIRLEVLPKALFYRQSKEVAFYEEFFDSVEWWATPDEDFVESALRIAVRTGLDALDALHVAAAVAVGADELVTTEKPSKPVHRVTEITVKTLYPGS